MMLRQLGFQLRWALPVWFIGLATNWMPENRIVCSLRGFLLRPFIRRCGRRLQIGAHVTLLNTHKLTVGDDVYIARGAWLNSIGGCNIADEVVIAPYVVISTAQHVFRNGSVRFGGSLIRPVSVGRGTWLAAHVSVRCGVTIGAGSLVAANACVVHDVASNEIVGGVPAVRIGPNADGTPDLFTRYG